MELGFYTFADVIPSPETEKTMSPAQRLRNLVEEIELADQVGLDVFGIGEHQRPEYAASAPVIVLDAAYERTHNIRLHFAPLVKIYRDAAQESGHDATILPVGITSHG